ncbi:agamous-like MADS-box protein AGL80 [Prunus yedoensis var. nudiflora]|uniref:Agamous-like MADS-box protein AGL80 n=1 Tax=Prunus yedoensis var. nudiflora TaxID=2094558 RepID=A0A314Z112_PRUYE|nr:agamous-like MADS-box protein AGL80 [Prunus yedoensis var. nudiflora]
MKLQQRATLESSNLPISSYKNHQLFLFMTRKKIDLAYIKNDVARKTTFKKRKSGLMKKVSELSILCGTDACAVIYGQHQANPDVSPCPDGALRTITRFKQMSKMERSRNMLNQESFLRQTILKQMRN